MAAKGFDYRRRRPWLAWGAEREWPPLNPIPADPNTYVYISSDHTTDPPTDPADCDAPGFEPTTNIEVAGAVTTNSNGTAISAAIANNTKGNWHELTAASGIEAQAIQVTIDDNQQGFDNPYLLDIGVGAAASETVLIPNLTLNGQGEREDSYYVPIGIAAGTRISARLQANPGNGSVRCLAHLVGGDASSGTVKNYGMDTATSEATPVNADAAADTKGAWTEITAATTNASRWVIVQITSDGGQFLVDLGKGAGGSETVMVGNMVGRWNGGFAVMARYHFPLLIPAGTRVSARCQSDGGGGHINIGVLTVED